MIALSKKLVCLGMFSALGLSGLLPADAKAGRKGSTWTPTNSFSDDAKGSKSGGDAKTDDELADDNSVKDKDKPDEKAKTPEHD